ncbi:MAG: coproporphyrinogen III oxidase, partial [Elusimicrobia bacterium]|nr:coproporphyrinogen III oxidase [Elusimicrobiota bacterium]
GLRLAEGIDLEEPARREFAREWSELEDLRLVERAGSRVRLSREGVFLANEVFCRFVAPFA